MFRVVILTDQGRAEWGWTSLSIPLALGRGLLMNGFAGCTDVGHEELEAADDRHRKPCRTDRKEYVKLGHLLPLPICEN